MYYDPHHASEAVADEESEVAEPEIDEAPEARRFTFTYDVEVPAPEKGAPVDVFVPLATSNEHQTIHARTIDASIEGVERAEPTYGNHFWHGHVDVSDGDPITVTVTHDVTREIFRQDDLDGADAAAVDDAQRTEHELFLGANAKVPVSGDLIERVRKDVPTSDGTLLGKARAIYDYVVDTMEYKKVGEGWGNGDTYWACSERYGNCTDFHALFTSLARAEGIPGRFEIGFQIPTDGDAGEIGGYHCWVQFFVPDVGWLPVDASEAWRHPDERELFFGTQPADRLQLTVGRDLELGDGHTSGPLNYFVYPHVEVAGRKVAEVTATLRYEE